MKIKRIGAMVTMALLSMAHAEILSVHALLANMKHKRAETNIARALQETQDPDLLIPRPKDIKVKRGLIRCNLRPHNAKSLHSVHHALTTALTPTPHVLKKIEWVTLRGKITKQNGALAFAVEGTPDVLPICMKRGRNRLRFAHEKGTRIRLTATVSQENDGRFVITNFESLHVLKA